MMEKIRGVPWVWFVYWRKGNCAGCPHGNALWRRRNSAVYHPHKRAGTIMPANTSEAFVVRRIVFVLYNIYFNIPNPGRRCWRGLTTSLQEMCSRYSSIWTKRCASNMTGTNTTFCVSARARPSLELCVQIELRERAMLLLNSIVFLSARPIAPHYLSSSSASSASQYLPKPDHQALTRVDRPMHLRSPDPPHCHSRLPSFLLTQPAQRASPRLQPAVAKECPVCALRDRVASASLSRRRCMCSSWLRLRGIRVCCSKG